MRHWDLNHLSVQLYLLLPLCITSDLRSRKWTISSPKETSTVGHGWNLYVIDTVNPLTLYQEMVIQIYLNKTSKKSTWMQDY